MRAERNDELCRFYVNVSLTFHIFGKPGAPRRYQNLLGLRLMPVTCRNKGSVPTALEFWSDLGFAHDVDLGDRDAFR